MTKSLNSNINNTNNMDFLKSVKVSKWGSSLVVPLTKVFKQMNISAGDYVVVSISNNVINLKKLTSSPRSLLSQDRG